MKWSEKTIAHAIARQVFQMKHLVMVPNCSWPGSECDLLVLTTDLRVIDVEVKISRADLKADLKKEKWYDRLSAAQAKERGVDFWEFRGDPRTHPRKVWKHYYAMPEDIWKDDLLEQLPAASGILLLRERRDRPSELPIIVVKRMAKPNRDCDRVSAGEAVDIARLASYRLWDAYAQVEQLQAERREESAA